MVRWTLLRERPGARLVSHGPLVCVYFTGHGTSDLSSLEADFDVRDRALEQWGELSQLVVFEVRNMARIGAESRAVASRRLARWGPSLRRAGLVVLGDGLAARMVRVALTMTTAISKTSAQHEVFERLGVALAWVKAAPGQHPAVEHASLEPLLSEFGIPER